jgi:hypothetical protein
LNFNPDFAEEKVAAHRRQNCSILRLSSILNPKNLQVFLG